MKKRRNYITLIIIFGLLLGALIIDWPGGFKAKYDPLKINFQVRDFNIKRGLDLQGGTRIVYSVDTSKIEESNENDAMNGLRAVIEGRINRLGVAEPIIQTTTLGSENRLVVELPGIQDVNQAMDLIGKTADLKFKELGETGEFKETDLTGSFLRGASQEYNQSGQPEVSIIFNEEGAKKFEEITSRNVGKPLAIELDGEIISAPNVNEKISGGKAQITGQFDLKEAKNLAIQLDAGALPVPIKVIEQRTVGASLGQEAVKKSIFAGLIGLLLVTVFMALYYRLPGIVADIALIFYAAFVLAIFKLIGVTITLAGVAAFILSIGMAVDANVLIFERMKEELKGGRSLKSAIEIGFSRAWTSIRDSNISSVITAGVLFIFGSGIIRGFAVVLIVGVLVSMFTAINVTRTFLRLLIGRKIFAHSKFYVGAKKEIDQ